MRALIDAERFGGAHPDLATFHGARHRALAAVFGGSDAVDADGRSSGARALASLLDLSVRQLVGLHSPFAIFLEAPRNIIELHMQFAGPINAGVESTTRAIEDLLVRVIADRYGIAEDASVSDEDLLANGFDPSTPWPDELDYW